MNYPSFVVILTSLFVIPAGTILAETETNKDVSAQELKVKQKQLEVKKAQADLEREELKLEKSRKALQVKESKGTVQFALSGDVLFDTNKAVLKPSARETLANVATVLSAFPDSNIAITGYTDSHGDSDMNLKLSRDRADAVKAWLLDQGISSERIITQGKGELDPVASNETEAGRQQNRRVEITLTKGAVAP